MTARIGVFKCLLHVSSDLPQLTKCVEHTLAKANYRSCYPPAAELQSVRERPTGSPLATLTSTLGLLSAGSFQKTCGNITPISRSATSRTFSLPQDKQISPRTETSSFKFHQPSLEITCFPAEPGEENSLHSALSLR